MTKLTTAQANETLAAAGFGPLDHMGTQYDDEGPYETFAAYPEEGAFGIWGSERGWRVVHAEDGIDYDEMAPNLDFVEALAKAQRLNGEAR